MGVPKEKEYHKSGSALRVGVPLEWERQRRRSAIKMGRHC